jgi:hypothetical protein
LILKTFVIAQTTLLIVLCLPVTFLLATILTIVTFCCTKQILVNKHCIAKYYNVEILFLILVAFLCLNMNSFY